MVKDTKTIIQEIEDFKTDNGGDYTDYYIGITNNIDRRLIENDSKVLEHMSSGKYKKGDLYYSAETESRDEAVSIELHFQNIGMQGFNPAAKGVEASKYIYSFKICDESKLLLEKKKNRMKHLMNYENKIKNNK
jgi:hypothetical protein